MMSTRSKKKGSNSYSYNNRGDSRGTPSNVRQSSLPRSNIFHHDSIYRNRHMVYTLTSLIGCKVEAELTSGSTYIGILRTISPQMEFALELACIKPNPGQVLSKSSLHSTLILKWDEVSKLSIVEGNSSNHNDIFKTDGEIGLQINGHLSDKKDLEPFQFDEGLPELSTRALESKDGERGWTAEAMFVTNEKKFNVGSSFNSEMTEYTVPLVLAGDETDHIRMQQADKKAKEIEMSYAQDGSYSIDDTGTEEELFSSVIRPETRQIQQNTAEKHHQSEPEVEQKKIVSLGNDEVEDVKMAADVIDESSCKDLDVPLSVVESKTESGNESKTESENVSVNESINESGSESKIESGSESKIESGNESKIESGNESKIESENESKIESGSESKIESGSESKIESGNESINDESTNNKTTIVQTLKNFKLNPDAQEFKPSQSPSTTASTEPSPSYTHTSSTYTSSGRPQRQRGGGPRNQQPRALFTPHDQQLNMPLYTTGYMPRMMHSQSSPVAAAATSPGGGYVSVIRHPTTPYGPQLIGHQGNQAFYSIPTSLSGTTTHHAQQLNQAAILNHPSIPPHGVGMTMPPGNVVYMPLPYNQPYTSLGPSGLLTYPQPQGGGAK